MSSITLDRTHQRQDHVRLNKAGEGWQVIKLEKNTNTGKSRHLLRTPGTLYGTGKLHVRALVEEDSAGKTGRWKCAVMGRIRIVVGKSEI